MLRNRKGVTLIEIMAVVVMAIIMTAIAFPHLKETRRAASMQSARTQVESYLAVARAVAIRNGVRSFLIRNGNTITILADSLNGQMVTVVRPIQLDSVSRVQLSNVGDTGADTIIYDSRGIAVNLIGTKKFYITAASGFGAGTRDSICVTRLGLVLDRNCGLAVAPPEKVEDLPIEEPPIDEGPIIVPPPIPVDK
jgi:Tfp pilus assembly protein FimT